MTIFTYSRVSKTVSPTLKFQQISVYFTYWLGKVNYFLINLGVFLKISRELLMYPYCNPSRSKGHNKDKTK